MASPTHAAQALAALSAQQTLSAESICSLDVLELLIDDFFTYIHPLCPFPHEPSFRAALNAREDLHNPTFLALIASMVAILVASFPRKPRLRLKLAHKENLFPNSRGLIDHCRKIALTSRGTGYLLKPDLGVYDAAVSYYLALTAYCIDRWQEGRLFMGEALTMIRVLGFHKADRRPSDLGTRPNFNAELVDISGHLAEHSNDGPVNYITREIGRRIFWVIFAAFR